MRARGWWGQNQDITPIRLDQGGWATRGTGGARGGAGAQGGTLVARGYRVIQGVLLKGALLLVTITNELSISLCVTQYAHLLTSVQ